MRHKPSLRALAILLLLMAISCQRDSLEEDIFQENINQIEVTKNFDYEVNFIRGETLTKNPVLKQRIDEINGINKIDSDNVVSSEVFSSSDYGFSINTNLVQLIEFNGLKSYTFQVLRDEPVADIVENYVLTVDSKGDYLQWLISYPRNHDFENGFDMNNATIENIEDPNLIHFSTIPDGQGCVPEITWQDGGCEFIPCFSGEHTLDSQDVGGCIYLSDPVKKPKLSCTEGSWVETPCPSGGSGWDPNDPGDNTNTGDGDTTNGGSTGGTGTNNGCTTCGNDEEDDDNDPPTCNIDPLTNTSDCPMPVVVFDPPADPCENLTSLLDPMGVDANAVFKSLRGDLGKNNENGFSFSKDANGNYSNSRLPEGNETSIDIPTGGNYYAGSHTHTDKLIPMFTFNDVLKLFNLFEAARADLKEEVFLTFQGSQANSSNPPLLYALSITDFQKLKQALTNMEFKLRTSHQRYANFDLSNLYEELEFRLQRKYKFAAQSTNTNTSGNSGEPLELIFLKEFKNAGLALHRAVKNNLGNVTNWTGLSLSDTELSVNTVPCN